MIQFIENYNIYNYNNNSSEDRYFAAENSHYNTFFPELEPRLAKIVNLSFSVYSISFIFTYLMHSGRHSPLYVNARVYQQLSAPCLWNWSLSIWKKTHLYMIALFSIHFIHLSKSFFFQSQNSVYIFPHISPSRSLCPWPTFCPSWEYYCAGFECRTSSFAKSTWFSIVLIHAQ